MPCSALNRATGRKSVTKMSSSMKKAKGNWWKQNGVTQSCHTQTCSFSRLDLSMLQQNRISGRGHLSNHMRTRLVMMIMMVMAAIDLTSESAFVIPWFKMATIGGYPVRKFMKNCFLTGKNSFEMQPSAVHVPQKWLRPTPCSWPHLFWRPP